MEVKVGQVRRWNNDALGVQEFTVIPGDDREGFNKIRYNSGTETTWTNDYLEENSVLVPHVEATKTYTNSEVMDLMEQWYFVEGDKIENDTHLILEVVMSASGSRLGFANNHGGQILFANGDRWTITLVDRWEECTVQEAADVVCVTHVKCVLDKVEFEIKEAKDWDFVARKYIAYGIWYKKVSR